jgi:rubredoxin
MYKCLSCGYLTLSEQPPGTFEICPVCRWRDDNVQADNPTLAGGANPMSLEQAKLNFARFGAVSKEMAWRVRKPLPEEIPE